jgi:hypothetical protein
VLEAGNGTKFLTNSANPTLWTIFWSHKELGGASIVVVLLTILVRGHETDPTRAGLRHATYDMDTITLDDPPSILFISVERAATPRFVELAHTLNHLQKLHCVVVGEAHLLLSDFRPVMKRLLP